MSRQFKTAAVLTLMSSVVMACGDASTNIEPTGTDPAVNEHVWQDPVDVLDTARATEDVLQESQQQRAKQLDADP